MINCREKVIVIALCESSISIQRLTVTGAICTGNCTSSAVRVVAVVSGQRSHQVVDEMAGIEKHGQMD